MISKKTCIVFTVTLLLWVIPATILASQVFRLSEIAPVSDLKLRSIKDSVNISLPVPERWKVKKAVLKFSYVNSTALLAYKSRLMVSLDEIPLAQIRLEPQSPEGTATVNIPAGLLTPGYHNLTFSSALHSERECEDPFAPELWTVVRLGSSTLSIDYDLLPIPLKLSAIPSFILDAKQAPNAKLNLVLESLTPEYLQIASIVAGGIGARMEYRPALMSISHALIPGKDNVVIGTKPLISSVTGPDNKMVKGAAIEIRHMPPPIDVTDNASEEKNPMPDTTHALIIISGENESDLKRAALSFASISSPFPQTQWMEIEKLNLPNLTPYIRKNLVRSGLPVTFKDLAFKTKVFSGMDDEPTALQFNLPPDLLIKPNEYASLSLHLAYSAACRKDSTMKITLNGKPVSSIHLDKEYGAVYEGYKVNIPTYLFKPGANIIRFHCTLMPLIIKRCEGFQDMNIFLTLFDDSIIRFPPMGHLGKLPALELFFDCGYPFLRSIDGKDSAVYMSKPSLSYAGLAMNLAAYFGQIQGYPPINLTYSFNLDKLSGKEILAIGALDSLPEELLQHAPWKLLEPANISYPQFSVFSEKEQSSWLRRIEERLEGFKRFFPVKAKPVKVNMLENHGELDNDTGLLMEFESPKMKGSSVVLWTARNEKAFDLFPVQLWLGELRARAAGDLTLFSLTDKKEISTLKIGSEYYSGKLNVLDRTEFYLRSYPWLYLSLLGASIIFLAIISALYLRKRRKKRLAGQE